MSEQPSRSAARFRFLRPDGSSYHSETKDLPPNDLIDYLGPALFVESGGELTPVAKWNSETMRLLAADCAERVLPLFVERYPDDERPRKAIEAGRRGGGAVESRVALVSAERAERDSRRIAQEREAAKAGGSVYGSHAPFLAASHAARAAAAVARATDPAACRRALAAARKAAGLAASADVKGEVDESTGILFRSPERVQVTRSAEQAERHWQADRLQELIRG